MGVIRISLFLFLGVIFSFAPAFAQSKGETFDVKSIRVPDCIIAPGRVEAEGEIDILSRVPGKVTKIYVEEGERFKPGQVLLSFDQGEIQAQQRAIKAEKASLEQEIRSLRSEIEYAKIWKERIESLLRQNAATKDEFDRAESRLKGLLSKEDALQEKIKALTSKEEEINAVLPYLEIKAADEGLVIKKMIKEGSHVNPGTPVLKILLPNKGLNFVAELGEQYLTKVKPQMDAYLILPKSDQLKKLKVTTVVEKIDEQTRTFRVKAKLDGTHTLGEFGRILISTGEKSVIVIPEKAIVKRGGLEGVIVKSERDTFRVVRTGRRWVPTDKGLLPYEFLEKDIENALVEILSGLKDGEKVLFLK